MQRIYSKNNKDCQHLGHITKDTMHAKRVAQSSPAIHPKHIGKSGTVWKYNSRKVQGQYKLVIEDQSQDKSGMGKTPGSEGSLADHWQRVCHYAMSTSDRCRRPTWE
jgi:hypothetical protein